jgi:hypothetical protein
MGSEAALRLPREGAGSLSIGRREELETPAEVPLGLTSQGCACRRLREVLATGTHSALSVPCRVGA